ncbi:Cytosolic 5-nucleotidase [Rhynchospora pubera]|uniref:5'-nucleotidase n=1 Tax=Rhynchospora pubera TaxID=906938 RepID=A0AAV8EJD1_9POAL|nr:Cytosolic 5-nucleotidase [Rhynchospora pubera]
MTPCALQRINPTTTLPFLRRTATAPLFPSKPPFSFLSSTSPSPHLRFSFSLSRGVAHLLHKRRCLCSKLAMSQVVVRDPDVLERKKASIRDVGPGKLQVIADFDGTLTKYWCNGVRGQTSHSLLQQGNAEYDAKRQALHEYYHPLEISPTIPIEEKTKLMEEWWEKTHGLLIEGGLTYDAIRKSVADASITFRDGVVQLFEFLEEKDIPVVIFSAGLADIIEEVFRQKLHRSFKNIKIVSNRMQFDESGRLVAFKGKTIHVFNKNEHAIDMAAPIHDKFGSSDSPDSPDVNGTFVKDRTNIVLLGDGLGDLGMSDGVSFEHRIAVGFLNSNIEKSLKDYSEAFDIVFLNDAPMWGVVDLVSELCSMKQ